MRTLPLFIALFWGVCLPLSAQVFGPKLKSVKDVTEEFALAAGQMPALTSDPARATIYITFDEGRGVSLACTNYKADTTNKTLTVKPLQGGMLDSSALRALFGNTQAPFSVSRLPIWITNGVFRVFLDHRFLDGYSNVSMVSIRGRLYPIRNRMAEIRPRLFASPAIELDQLNSFLFERPFDPVDAECVSLLNNEKVNDVFDMNTGDFSKIRTVDQVEKAFETSKKPSVYFVGHISADGQVRRYRSGGDLSYELPVVQFLHFGSTLNKEVILIGCNFADDTSRTLDVAAETEILKNALPKRLWGEVLLSLAGEQNQVQITEQNSDGFYFKRAEVSRPDGVKPARAYTFIFFRTPAKPSAALTVLRFVYGNSGFILAALVALQLLFFFVFKSPRAAVWKWVNLALVFIFTFVFLFSRL
jgi:hypothetical protein